MGTYVMSDIHGCYDAFMRMLDKIGFGIEDRLIIAGDIIDRGGQNFEMLEWLENKPANIEVLMGNHEYDFTFANVPAALEYIDAYDQDAGFTGAEIDPYYDQYGTLEELIRKGVTPGRLAFWAQLMRRFKYYRILNINDKKYIIVHACYVSEEKYKRLNGTLEGITDYYIWNRDAFFYDEGRGDTIVFGHTPTIFDKDYFADGKVYRVKFQGNTFINIDCGYVYKEHYPNANLAAIRLDDEEIFYLE